MNDPIIKVHAPVAGNSFQALPVRGAPDADGISAALNVHTVASTGGAVAPITARNLTSDNVDGAIVAALDNASFLYGFDGTFWDRIRALPEADLQAVLTGGSLVTHARLEGFNGATYERIRSRSDAADAQAPATLGALLSLSRLQAFNDVAYDRLRTGNAINLAFSPATAPLLITNPGEWSAISQPAVSVIATATRAAGGGVTRNICKSISVSSSGPAVQTSVDVVLRDGVSGVGTILWVGSLSFAAGDSKHITISGLNIVGSINTAMTLEFQAAPVATNFQRVTLTGFLAA